MSTFRTIGIAGTVAALLFSTSVAFAAVREETKANTEAAREAAKAKMETAREEAKQKMEMAREEAKTRMETVREAAKVKMEAVREKAKQRLSDIRDKKKQELALKLAEQFGDLNKKWTDRFTEQLDRLSGILLKIQEKADTAAADGKDTTATNTAIQSAKTAINTAQTAVTAQAAKTYTLDTSSITTSAATTASDNGQDELIKGLRTQFQSLHRTLFKDLYTLRDGVMRDAHKSARDALETFLKVSRIDGDDNAASAAQ